MKILIAEDDEKLQQVYRYILKKSNTVEFSDELIRFIPDKVDYPRNNGTDHDLTLVSQGEQAIVAINEAQAAGCPFDIAILDVRMPPGITGVAVAKFIRANHSDLPVILCTAFADFTWSDLIEHFPSGVSLLRKPFNHIELTILVTSLAEKLELVRENRRLRNQEKA